MNADLAIPIPATPAPDNPFAPSSYERRRRRAATRNKWFMFGFCALLVIPLLLILVHIFVKAAPLFSLHYLWDNPVNKGKAGGLWAPLVGTFYLVVGSLIVVVLPGVVVAIIAAWLTGIVARAVGGRRAATPEPASG